MVFQYYPESDMLYIELLRGVSAESQEVAPGIVLDFDENNQVLGIEIEEASKLANLSSLEVSALPITSLVFNSPTPVTA